MIPVPTTNRVLSLKVLARRGVGRRRPCLFSSSVETPPAPLSSLSIYDPHTSDWRDWFPSSEYQHPWDVQSTAFGEDSQTTITLEEEAHAKLDRITKQVLWDLQQFHHFSNITTAQCNSVLNDLLQQTSDNNGNNTNPSLSRLWLTRAQCILQAMQVWETKQNHPLTPRRGRLPPTPDRETYGTVLQLYANTPSHTLHVPNQAKALVKDMETQFQTHANVETLVTAFHWNCVVRCFGQCSDKMRTVYALEVVLQQYKCHQLDDSSLVHLLRMCVPQFSQTTIHNNNDSAVEQARLGSSVAIKAWDTIVEGNTATENGPLTLPPHVYAHFLQAIRPLPLQSKVREEYFEKCLRKAIDNQCVNVHIVKEFILNASPRLYGKYFYQYKSTVGNKKGHAAAKVLMQLIPESWCARAKNVDPRRVSVQ